MKLMIVDDEPYILEGLTKIIKEALTFIEIEEATDAFEALYKMSGFHPDVVITDLNMPEKDGFALIEEAKQAGYCDRFVVLTGYDEFEYARKAIRAKVVEYLLKPINQDEIVAILEEIAKEMQEQHSETVAEFGCHMDKIMDYIEKYYNDPLSLDDLAGYTGLHPNYISSLFHKERGVTFIRYLNMVRIEKAKELLEKEPNTPVNVVGQRVGFESPQHFVKIFKRNVGTTPGAYKEKASQAT